MPSLIHPHNHPKVKTSFGNIRKELSMDIFSTITALFSGERVSHTDTFILAILALALYIGIRKIGKRIKDNK